MQLVKVIFKDKFRKNVGKEKMMFHVKHQLASTRQTLLQQSTAMPVTP